MRRGAIEAMSRDTAPTQRRPILRAVGWGCNHALRNWNHENFDRANGGINMANLVVHWELGTHDAGRLGKFYTGLFGWRIEKQSSMEYSVVYTNSKLGINGGIVQIDESTSPFLTFYVVVKDLQETLATAENLGATIASPPTPIPAVGTFAQITDPEGFLIGVIEPPPDWDEQAASQAREGEQGNPVIHWEISAANAERLHDFYTSLFEWRIDTDTPNNYPMVQTGGIEGIDGGIVQVGIDDPRILTVYVAVDDVRATIDKARRLGAKSAGPPITVPGIGSFAHISDPDGHTIGVMQETEVEDGLG